ncbi:hypothetical protein OF83DRAFT_1167794 [Amylostereum chailletii]|nr:hypothetical protein OF83DRAFT_1167794 [Amylostereum chailletii]
MESKARVLKYTAENAQGDEFCTHIYSHGEMAYHYNNVNTNKYWKFSNGGTEYRNGKGYVKRVAVDGTVDETGRRYK